MKLESDKKEMLSQTLLLERKVQAWPQAAPTQLSTQGERRHSPGQPSPLPGPWYPSRVCTAQVVSLQDPFAIN